MDFIEPIITHRAAHAQAEAGKSGENHLRQQVDQGGTPQLECSIHPLTRMVLTSRRRAF
jgi:hypothetical protein